MTLPGDQRDYWNGPGAAKNFTTPVPVHLLADRLPRDAAILDYGCGYGRALIDLAEAGFANLTGLDSARAMIERGKALYPDLDLRLVEPGRIPFDDADQNRGLDAVLLLAVLTCLPVDQDRADLVAEARRVLRPGGLLLINDFLLNTDQGSQARYREYAGCLGPYGTFQLPDGGVVRHYAPDDLRALCSDWNEEYWEEAAFTTMNGHVRQGVTCLFSRP